MRLDATGKETPSRMKPGRMGSLDARWMRENARWTPVQEEEPGGVWIPDEVKQVIQSVVDENVVEIWVKRHVEEPSWKGIAVQDVDDESDGSFVPGGYEKWTLPVCQGVVTVIWTNVTCADVWEAIDDDSWTLCARSAR